MQLKDPGKAEEVYEDLRKTMMKDLKIAKIAFDKIGIGGISEEEFHFVGCPPELTNLINYRAARQSDFEAQRKLEEMQRRTDESLARRVRR